jgi:hypothetical protein
VSIIDVKILYNVQLYNVQFHNVHNCILTGSLLFACIYGKLRFLGTSEAPRVKEIVSRFEIAYTYRILSIYDYVEFVGLYLCTASK